VKSAVFSLRATDAVELRHLAHNLELALNRPGHATVVVTARNGSLRFSCRSTEADLRSRVEKVLDHLVGAGWRQLLVPA
jgi:hypothetical protein